MCIRDRDYTSSLLSTATFAQRVWHIRRSTPSQPKCKHQQCNSFAPWDPQASNYQIYCSKKCSVSDPAKVEVYRKTTAEKYGGHPMQNDEVLAARKQSALTRYGVDSYSKTSEFKKKVKETCIARYGVSNPMKTTEVKETLKISNICLLYTSSPSGSGALAVSARPCRLPAPRQQRRCV